MKQLSSAEIKRRHSRLEIDQASDIRCLVQCVMARNPINGIAALQQSTGMPKSLIKKLSTDRAGYLHDCVLWNREKQKKEIEE